MLSPKRGITHLKFDGMWRNINLILGSSIQSHMQNFSSIPQSMTKKVRKTELLRFSKSKKGHFSPKSWRNLTKLELYLWLITTYPYTKFQLNILKHDEKKCGKLNCYDFLSPKRGITHSKFDGIWRNANLICGSSLQSHIQNFSSIP